MKRFYEFLFYKLYRFAISNEESASINWSFISLATMFEILHLLLVGLLQKSFFEFHTNINLTLFSVLFLLIGTIINYLYFIKSKRIERIHSYFQEKNYSVWKGNLLFLGYVILLFIIMFNLPIIK